MRDDLRAAQAHPGGVELEVHGDRDAALCFQILKGRRLDCLGTTCFRAKTETETETETEVEMEAEMEMEMAR